MLKKLKRATDRFFGVGEADTSVPVLDGALKPNNLLDTAEIFLEHAKLEDMVIDSQGQLIVASDHEIFQVDPTGNLRSIKILPQPIQALATFGEGLVVATSDGLSFVNGEFAGKHVTSFDGQPARCITALCEGPDGLLLIAEGSRQTVFDDWAIDLLNWGSSGRLITYDPKSDHAQIRAQNLAYCNGVCSDGKRTLLSESWAHQLSVWQDGELHEGLSQIPGYPSRISSASHGGFWLTIFAPRSQLQEFVLREDAFRTEMMQTVEPKYWIAPALSSGNDFLEPLQQGGVRQMGVLKPWAPARSYGLVLRLSSDLVPIYSLHSRVGGLHHGIVAALEHDGALLVLSKGSGRILRVPLADLTLQG